MLQNLYGKYWWSSKVLQALRQLPKTGWLLGKFAPICLHSENYNDFFKIIWENNVCQMAQNCNTYLTNSNNYGVNIAFIHLQKLNCRQ